MPRRADYSSEEWALLASAPEIIGLGMLGVSRSGPVGKLRELLILRSCLQAHTIPLEFRQNSLVMDILGDSSARPHKPLTPPSTDDSWATLIVMVIAARLHMLEYSEEVAALIADRAPRDEAAGLKRWLMLIARRVAGASGDGWLGMGPKVSDVENAMLQQLSMSLQITTVDAAPTPAELEAMFNMRPAGDDEGIGGYTRNWQ